MLFAPAFEAWDEIDDLISSVGLFIIIILAFQVRKILTQHYIDKLGMNIGFSGLGTFFFHIFYLQYKINRLPVSAEP